MNQSTGGYEIVLGPVLLGLGGLWIDGRLGTTPWLTVILAVLGLIGAVANVVYRYRHEIARIEAETAALRRAAGSPPTEGGT